MQPTGDELHTPGYVHDDPRWAREHGYGGRIQRAQDRARTADPDIAYYRKLSPERRLRWGDALFGGPGAETVEARPPDGGTVSMAAEGCNRRGTAHARRRRGGVRGRQRARADQPGL